MDEAGNPTKDSMGPRDSGPKREKGNDTAKTLEDIPTGNLESKATTPQNSPTNKMGRDAKTLTPPANCSTAVDNERKHRYPAGTENEYNRGNQYAKPPSGTEPMPKMRTHRARSKRPD